MLLQRALMTDRRLLAIAHQLPPAPLVGGIQAGRLLCGLREEGWEIDVVTACEGAEVLWVGVHAVCDPGPPWWAPALGRLKLDKLAEWGLWPDAAAGWVDAAVAAAKTLIERRRPQVILNFMMPYSAGLVGARLKRETGLPLVYCLGDSLTCSDMHPSHASRGHWRRAVALEDEFVRTSDATVYVSQFNADQVRSRQPAEHADKVHVVRRGAVPGEFSPAAGAGPDPHGPLRITYLGALGGWHSWYQRRPTLSRLKQAWDGLGRYRLQQRDHRTHTPVYVGHAVRQVVADHPDWSERVLVDVYGSHSASDWHIRQVLEQQGLPEIVQLHGRLPPHDVGRVARRADVLFLCLPRRVDGSPGGIISAKTYEYLLTDRPILAAVPRGENWDFLKDKPGVWLTAPDDVAAMRRAIETFCEAKLIRGEILRFDRAHLTDELNSANRGRELSGILASVTGGVLMRECERSVLHG